MGYEMCYFTRPYQFIRDTLRKHKNVTTINLNFLRKNNIYYLSPPFLSHTTSKKKKAKIVTNQAALELFKDAPRGHNFNGVVDI